MNANRLTLAQITVFEGDARATGQPDWPSSGEYLAPERRDSTHSRELVDSRTAAQEQTDTFK